MQVDEQNVYNILKSKYELEQKIMRNALAVATLVPLDFKYALIIEKRYMVIVTSDVMNLI